MKAVTVSRHLTRPRIVGGVLGLLNVFFLARLAVRLSAGAFGGHLPGSTLDRLVLFIEPAICCLGLAAAVGLWRERRWGVAACTAWIALVAAQMLLIAFVITGLAGFAPLPVIIWLSLLGVGFFAAYRFLRALRRWMNGRTS